MLNFDLHCHSNVSDGLLDPSEVVRMAARNHVVALALTDHDDTAGLEEARRAALAAGIQLINGVEISVTWEKHTVHVLGLRIDPDEAALRDGLTGIRAGRLERAERIGAALAKAGIGGALEGARSFTSNENIIGRTHFARFLVREGYAKDIKSVFKRYLVKGKPGHTAHEWASLSDAVRWISASGGQGVLAHPGRYSMGPVTRERLLAQFRAAGGAGLEVVTSNHTAEQVRYFALQAVKHGLLASRGSDYHGPGESYREPGCLARLPEGCKAIWHDWAEASVH
jgi:3',5'-nucleoside bisphosphate phosphatase